MRKVFFSVPFRFFAVFVAVQAIALVGPRRAPAAQTEPDEGASLLVRALDPQGALVPGARIAVLRSDDGVRLAALAGEEGAYRFGGLAPGVYLVRVEAPGFRAATARRVRVAAGEETVVDVRLELAAVEEQLVVTSSAAPETAEEVAKAVTLVTDREIDERDELFVAEAVRTAPGVRVQQLGGPGGLVTIRVRGLRNEDTAVLLDGVRLRDAAAPQGDATGVLDGLVATSLDRIEILRGSGSSLYGTNAIGGVLNVVTRDGGGRLRGGLLAEGGSLGLFRGRAQVAGGLDDDRIAFAAGLARLDVGRGLDGDDEASSTSLQGRLQARLGPTATLAARVYAADTAAMLNESPQAVGALPPSGIVEAVPVAPSELARFEAGVPAGALRLDGASFLPSANDPDNEREASFVSTLVSFEQRPSPRVGYSLRYHGLATDRRFLDGPAGVGFEPIGRTRSDFDGRIDTLRVAVELDGAGHTLTAGYELERERYESFNHDDAAPDLDAAVEAAQRSHALFVQDRLRLAAGALQLGGAVRAQFFSLDAPRFTPAASAPFRGIDVDAPPRAVTADGSFAYFLRGSGTKLRAHVGNGYRAPSLFERYGAFFSSFGYSVFGDPRLGPERSVSFDGGIDQEIAGGRGRVSATYFFTRLSRVIVFDFSGAIDPATDPFGRFGGYRRVEGGDTQGVELSVTAVPAESLRLGLAYTYVDAEPPAALGEDLPRAFVVPEHELSLVATQRLGRELYVNVELTVSSDYLAPVFDPGSFTSRTFSFDGIARADVVASYALALGRRHVRVFVKVENLFDRTYFESGFRTSGRTAVAGLTTDF